MPRASQRLDTHSISRTPLDSENSKPQHARIPEDSRESLSPIINWSFFESLALPGENIAYSLHDGNGTFIETTSSSECVWGSKAHELQGISLFDIVEDNKDLRDWMLQADRSADDDIIEINASLGKHKLATITIKSIPLFIASDPEKSRIVLKSLRCEPKTSGNPFSNANTFISVHTTDGKFLSANSHWKNALEQNPKTLSIFDLVDSHDSEILRRLFDKVLETQHSQSCALQLKVANGKKRSLLVSGSPDTSVAQAIALETRDITLDPNDLANSLLTIGIDCIQESVLILMKEEHEFKICYTNKAFEQMTGYTQSSIVGSPFSKLKGPKTETEAAQSIKDAIRKEQNTQVDLTLYRKDNSSFSSKANLHPLRDNEGQNNFFILSIEDITEEMEVARELENRNQELKEALENLKETQKAIIQQENLRALGQMASGIAHDFNNLLAPILGFSELLLTIPENAKNEKKLIPYLKRIQVAAKDGAAVVGRLREFYRSQNGDEEFTEINPEDLVQQAKEITSHRWKNQAEANGTHITFETSIESKNHINGDVSELRQVLTNLIINSVDAIGESGTIQVEVKEANNFIFIKVSDTGSGMSPETKAKCLDPFYTTKGQLGTGLGLSIVLGVVQRHGGQFNVESELGKGTEISMSFPAIQVDTENTVVPETTLTTSRLRVLLVDDEEVLLEVISELLSSSGHIVDNYSDPHEALSEFEANNYDLVITDRAMPTMSGDKLAEEIKKISPDTPVFMVTGFGELIKDTGDYPEFVDEVLPKPLPLDVLNQKVSELRAKRS